MREERKKEREGREIINLVWRSKMPLCGRRDNKIGLTCQSGSVYAYVCTTHAHSYLVSLSMRILYTVRVYIDRQTSEAEFK